MGLLDKLFKSPAEDLLSGAPPGGGGAGDEADALASVQEMYGLPAEPVSPGPGSGPPSAAPAPGARTSVGQPSAPASGAAPPDGPQPASSSEPAGAGVESAPLDSPLRDLFTEASTMDPQLESLLKRVEKVDARGLAEELREFSRSVGADSTQ